MAEPGSKITKRTPQGGVRVQPDIGPKTSKDNKPTTLQYETVLGLTKKRARTPDEGTMFFEMLFGDLSIDEDEQPIELPAEDDD